MRRTALVLLVLAAAALAGCSSTTRQAATPAPAAKPPAAPASAAPPISAPAVAAAPAGDRAYVTVYRKKRIVGAILNTSVYVDRVEVADLDPGTYVRVAVAPGPHTFWADEEKDAVTLDLQAGREYFFRMGLVPGLWKGHGRLEAVDEATGRAEFGSWAPKLAKDIRQPAMVVPAGKP